MVLPSCLPLLLAAVGALACVDKGRPEDRTRAVTAPAITDSVLGALTYPVAVLPGIRVTLVNGSWASDSTRPDRQAVDLTLTAHGDLSGDREPDAVVVLLSDPGATGRFLDLVPVLATRDGPRVGRPTALGDRVRPETLWVAAGLAHLRLVTHDSTDGLCCPTRREERSYRLQSDSLTLERAELLERIPPA